MGDSDVERTGCPVVLNVVPLLLAGRPPFWAFPGTEPAFTSVQQG